MTETDNLSFYDYGRDDKTQYREERKSRHIKMKPSSLFANTASWVKKRVVINSEAKLEAAEENLKRMKDNALAMDYKANEDGTVSTRAMGDLFTKARHIAKLEENIMVLSKQSVPDNYVARRAIKLRERMAANLFYNSQGFYTLGIDSKTLGHDRRKEIFDAPEGMPHDVELENDDIAVVPNDEEVERIRDSVEDGFNNAPRPTLSREEIDNLVKSMLNNVDEKSNEDEDFVVNSQESELSSDDIRNVIDSQLESVDDEVVSRDDIEDSINQAIDEVQVIKNPSTVARVDKYDDDGNLRANSEEVEPAFVAVPQKERYSYKPMLDEDVEMAKENIDYEEYEHTYQDNKSNGISGLIGVNNVDLSRAFVPVDSTTAEYDDISSPVVETVSNLREMPVVVPEREVGSYLYNNDKVDFTVTAPREVHVDQNLQFDYSNATASDITSAIGRATTLDELYGVLGPALKRVSELKKREAETRESIEKAAKEAEAAAAEAAQAKDYAKQKEEEYKKQMEKVEMYAASLNDECEINISKEKAIRDAAERDRRFTEEQMERASSIDQMMAEIDSVIGGNDQNLGRSI